MMIRLSELQKAEAKMLAAERLFEMASERLLKYQHRYLALKEALEVLEGVKQGFNDEDYCAWVDAELKVLNDGLERGDD